MSNMNYDYEFLANEENIIVISELIQNGKRERFADLAKTIDSDVPLHETDYTMDQLMQLRDMSSDYYIMFLVEKVVETKETIKNGNPDAEELKKRMIRILDYELDGYTAEYLAGFEMRAKEYFDKCMNNSAELTVHDITERVIDLFKKQCFALKEDLLTDSYF